MAQVVSKGSYSMAAKVLFLASRHRSYDGYIGTILVSIADYTDGDALSTAALK